MSRRTYTGPDGQQVVVDVDDGIADLDISWDRPVADAPIESRTWVYSEPEEWHRDGWRCRFAEFLYRIAAGFADLADRIDPPSRHGPAAPYTIESD